MFFSSIAVLAIVHLARAAPPAQSTYCSEDNLLRAFQHTLTPAKSYCRTATGQPTCIPATTYPQSRFSSACSCFSRFPSEASPTPTPSCIPSVYLLSGTSTTGDALTISFSLDITKTCQNKAGQAGYPINLLCGSLDTTYIVYNPAETYMSPSNCYVPGATIPIDSGGVGFDIVDFGAGTTSPAILFYKNALGQYDVKAQLSGDHYFTSIAFTGYPCGAMLTCNPLD